MISAITVLCAEISRSLSFDVVLLSLRALTWVVNSSDDADQIASIAVAFQEAAYGNFTRIRFCGLCGLEDAICRHFVVACDLGGLIVGSRRRADPSSSRDICLAHTRDVFELGDDSEILAMVREGLADIIIEAGNRATFVAASIAQWKRMGMGYLGPQIRIRIAVRTEQSNTTQEE